MLPFSSFLMVVCWPSSVTLPDLYIRFYELEWSWVPLFLLLFCSMTEMSSLSVFNFEFSIVTIPQYPRVFAEYPDNEPSRCNLSLDGHGSFWFSHTWEIGSLEWKIFHVWDLFKVRSHVSVSIESQITFNKQRLWFLNLYL